MLQTLSGDCYELPAKLSRKVDAVWEWWWKELKADPNNVGLWPCQVKVTDVTEMKRVEREEREEKEEKEESKKRRTYGKHYFGVIVGKTVRLRSYGQDYGKLYRDFVNYWSSSSSHSKSSKSSNNHLNESILSYLCSVPPQYFPQTLLAHPHPQIVDWILSVKDESFWRSGLFWLASNPDPAVMQAIERTYQAIRGDRMVEYNFQRGRRSNPSLGVHSFASTDPDVIQQVWEEVSGRDDLFRQLPVNNEPTAVSLILRDFDQFRLHRFPFVYMCADPQVLSKCLENFDDSHYTNLLANPSDVVADWLLSNVNNLNDYLEESALNTNDRVVEWQLANPPSRRNDRYWKLIRNPHPHVTDWVCRKLDKMPLDSLKEIIGHIRANDMYLPPLPGRVMAELIHRHGLGDCIPTMLALQSFIDEEDVTVEFI